MLLPASSQAWGWKWGGKGKQSQAGGWWSTGATGSLVSLSGSLTSGSQGVGKRDQSHVRLAQAWGVFELFPSLGRELHLAERFTKNRSNLDGGNMLLWALPPGWPVQNLSCSVPYLKVAAKTVQEEIPMQVILALLHSSETLH